MVLEIKVLVWLLEEVLLAVLPVRFLQVAANLPQTAEFSFGGKASLEVRQSHHCQGLQGRQYCQCRIPERACGIAPNPTPQDANTRSPPFFSEVFSTLSRKCWVGTMKTAMRMMETTSKSMFTTTELTIRFATYRRSGTAKQSSIFYIHTRSGRGRTAAADVELRAFGLQTVGGELSLLQQEMK